MLKQLSKLIDVKSITTFVIIGGVTYGFIVGSVDGQAYMALAGSIIAYYFTKRSGGGSGNAADGNND